MLNAEQAPVARLHLRSTVYDDHVAIEDWCLRDGGDGWAGVGWGLWYGDEYDGLSWDRYRAELEGSGKEVSRSVQRLHDLPNGALIWTRRRDSSYWLGRLTGEWRYRDGDEAQSLDLFNLRPCRWYRVGADDSVPGKVVNNFNSRITLNPVSEHTAWGAVQYTRRLWRQLDGEGDAINPADPRDVIESLLGALDLEDLVAAFLQDRHELVLVSRRSSNVGYEYVLRDRSTGRRAVATVKSGGDSVDLDALPSAEDADVWAFTVQNRNWTGQARDDIRWIATAELIDFMVSRRPVLPDQVVRWLS